MRSPSFGFSRPHILESKPIPNHVSVQDTFLEALVRNSMLILNENCRFWLSKSSGRQIGIPDRQRGAKLLHICMFSPPVDSFVSWPVSSKLSGHPPLHILNRWWLSFRSLIVRFRDPFNLISLYVGLVLERRCRQSWVLWQWVGGAPEGITILLDICCKKSAGITNLDRARITRPSE